MDSMAYWEQVGVKRQPPVEPKMKSCAGEIVQRYAQMADTKICWAGLKVVDLRLFQQTGAAQGRQVIFLNFRKRSSGNRVAGDQNNLDRLRQLMLMLAKTFPQQTPRAVPLDCAADFFAGDDA
jgi:hypothetical protein